MNRYKIVMMIPQETYVDEPDLQAAHNRVTRMLSQVRDDDPYKPYLHSIEELGPLQTEFEEPPPGAA